MSPSWTLWTVVGWFFLQDYFFFSADENRQKILHWNPSGHFTSDFFTWSNFSSTSRNAPWPILKTIFFIASIFWANGRRNWMKNSSSDSQKKSFLTNDLTRKEVFLPCLSLASAKKLIMQDVKKQVGKWLLLYLSFGTCFSVSLNIERAIKHTLTISLALTQTPALSPHMGLIRNSADMFKLCMHRGL